MGGISEREIQATGETGKGCLQKVGFELNLEGIQGRQEAEMRKEMTHSILYHR